MARRAGSAPPAAPASRVIYGARPVAEALARHARRIEVLFVDARGGRRAREIARQAERAGVAVQPADRQALDALAAGGNHQGVAAVAGAFPYRPLSDLLTGGERAALLVVDGVTDPRNLGAMMRAALVLGATGCVLTRDRCAPVTPVVVRVSAGASEHLPVARVTNLRRAIDEVKAGGIWVAGAVAEGGVRPDAADLTVPLALVLGSEGKGIRPLVLAGCDLRLTVPMAGPVASLNVAAATAVLFYEALRQREPRGRGRPAD